jgi:hypothetical protein
MLHPNRFQFIIVLDPTGRALMTRDMELIRKIFAEIQSRNDLHLRPVDIPGAEDWIVARHAEMLLDAGLLDGIRSNPINQSFPTIAVKDLSMAGHDFAAALANDSVWGAIKTKFSASEIALMPLKVLEKLASGFLMKWAMSKAGLE